jgi:membrane protein YqaA with SNARE-associated domain
MQLPLLKHLQNKISDSIKWSQKFTDKSWYPLLIGFFAFIDNLIVIVPTDGLLVSSILLRARRWLWFALAVTVGSSLGALLLAYLIEIHGMPWILNYFPNLNKGWAWMTTEKFFLEYGLIVVFAVAAAPVFQHPAIVLAAVSNIALVHIFLAVFAGRLIKYLVMGYISSHAPKMLGKLWGLGEELEEVGVKDFTHAPSVSKTSENLGGNPTPSKEPVKAG